MGFTLDPGQVRGDIFKPGGKWMYTVQLDYSDCDYNDWNLHEQARKALADATDKNISGVIFREIPDEWFLVVLEPSSKNSHPITVWRAGTPNKT